MQETPKTGSQWFNNRRQKTYTVFGTVAHCEDGDEEWEVLYRSNDMPEGQFRRRSVESWYGTNRDGQPRFVEIDSGRHTAEEFALMQRLE
jgi:hypothetical protein